MASLKGVKDKLLDEMRVFPGNPRAGTAVVATKVNVPGGATAIQVYTGNYAPGTVILRNDSATTLYIGSSSAMVATAAGLSIPLNPAAQVVFASVDLSKLYCLTATAGESGATLTILFAGCTK